MDKGTDGISNTGSITSSVINAAEDKTAPCELPEPPERPLPGDCCGTGCTPCVFDIYDKELVAWEEECCRIREGRPHYRESFQSQEDAITTSEYRKFTIESVVQDSPNTFIFRFSIPNRRKLGLKVGQHIVLRWKTEGHTITRQYTPVSEVTASGYFDVLIKIYEDGRMSQYLRTWAVGDVVEWRGPYGSFTYKRNTYRRVVLLAAGTGLAPMAQVVGAVLAEEEDETILRLVLACRHYEEVPLKQQLDEWADYWNFSAIYYLSRDSPDRPVQRRYGDEIQYCRLNEEKLRAELGENAASNTLVLISGTKSFDKDMVNYLRRLGLPEENYFKF